MAGCCGPKCSKAFVIFFNILFWFSGCALVALGVVLLYDQTYSYVFILLSGDLPPVILQYTAFGCIGLGGIILFVGFFGCCGALQDSKCMLGTYVFFLILVFLVEAAAALLGAYGWCYFPIQGDLKYDLKDKLIREYGIPENSPDHPHPFTNAVKFVQYELECCGIDGKDDWMHSKWINNTNAQTPRGANKVKVPITCCVVDKAEYVESDEPWNDPKVKDRSGCQGQEEIDYKGTLYDSPCWTKLENWFNNYALILIPTLGGLSLLQIIGIIFSICLIRNIGEEA